MTWIQIISALLGLSCVVLAGRNSKYNFYVGYAYNVFLFILFWNQSLYAAMCLQPVSLIINAFGHYRWTHPRENERSIADSKKLRVGQMNALSWLIILGINGLAGTAWALVLKNFSSDPMPWLDAYILMFTLTAQYLSAKKVWQCWVVWLIVNVANIVLYLASGLYLMPIVSALYLANGIWSLVSWKKMYLKNE